MYSFQKRSQSIEHLKKSQSVLNISATQSSRNGSTKKFIQVCSKKGYQPHGSSIRKNLADSNVSLPINFEERREIPRNHLAQSQVYAVSRQNHLIINQNIPNTIREHSMPSKKIIIRQTIIHTPVNFNYIQHRPSNPRMEPVHNYNFRQSLPLKIIQNKNEIIRQNPIKQAATPIRIFSQNSPIINTITPIRRMPQKQIPITLAPQVVHSSHLVTPPTYQIQSEHIFPKQQNIQRYRQTQMLSNKFYVECEVKLIPKDEIMYQSRLKNSQIKQNKPKEEQLKTNYNSLTVTKEDEEGILKQNLQIRKKDCMCEKIKNFTQCSNIKINVKQALMPKRNIIQM